VGSLEVRESNPTESEACSPETNLFRGLKRLNLPKSPIFHELFNPHVTRHSYRYLSDLFSGDVTLLGMLLGMKGYRFGLGSMSTSNWIATRINCVLSFLP